MFNEECGEFAVRVDVKSVVFCGVCEKHIEGQANREKFAYVVRAVAEWGYGVYVRAVGSIEGKDKAGASAAGAGGSGARFFTGA